MSGESKSVWIVSTEPASTEYGGSSTSASQLRFKEQVSLAKLKAMVSEFATDLAGLVEDVQSSASKYDLDSVEINAVMAADGKLGIFGSSVGGKVEGGLKFVLKLKR